MLPLLNLYSQDSSAYSKLYQDSGFSCGVVDVPLTSNEYFQPASTNQFSSDQVFVVPVNAYLLLNEEERLRWVYEDILEIDQYDALSRLKLQINQWNDKVPRIQLELCSFHVISVPIHESGYPPYINRWLRSNHPEIMTEDSNESLQVFISGGEFQPQGHYPAGISVHPLPTAFMHEVGHFFGLRHTSWGTFGNVINEDGDREGCIFILPDNTLVDNCHPGDPTANAILECVDTEPGLCSGDYVSDTAVDIKGFNDLCTTTVTVVINGVEYVYSPPYNNLMRSLPSEQNMTEGQKNRMLRMLMGELPPTPTVDGFDPIQPDYSILLSNSLTSNNCIDFEDVVPTTLYRTSFVNLVKVSDNNVRYSPVYRGKLSYTTHNTRPPLFSEGGVTRINIFEGEAVKGIVEVDRGGSIQFQFDEFETGCSEVGLFNEENLKVNDVLGIIRHITDDAPLESPYLKIAADVNNSGSISTADAVFLIKRLLGVTDRFPVPDFRMIPELVFASDETFATEFKHDPFTADWSFQGKLYGYLQDADRSSYLGDRLEDAGMPNILGFKHQFPSEYTQIREAVSFEVIETGNIYQSDEQSDEQGAQPGRVVLTVDDQSSLTSLSNKVAVTVSIAPDQNIQALLARFDHHESSYTQNNTAPVRFSESYPKINMLDSDFTNFFGSGHAKMNCIYSGSKGFFSYADKSVHNIKNEILFKLILDVESEIEENDIVSFLGAIDFWAKDGEPLNLNVLIENVNKKNQIMNLIFRSTIRCEIIESLSKLLLI